MCTAKDHVWRHALGCQDSMSMQHAMCEVFTLETVEIVTCCSLIDLCRGDSEEPSVSIAMHITIETKTIFRNAGIYVPDYTV